MTIRGDGKGKNRSTMSLPRQAFLQMISPFVIIIQTLMIHMPAPNLPILVSTPHQPIPFICNQTQRRWSPNRFLKRRTLFLTAPRNAFSSDATPRRVEILEVPEPYPALRGRPQLRFRCYNVPQETPNLCLPQRMRPQFKARRPRRRHRRTNRWFEDSGTASFGNELR